MADNFSTDAEGAVPEKSFAADDIAGVLHPRVKVEFGANGSATDVSSSDPLPVDVPAAARTSDAVAAAVQTDAIMNGGTVLTPKFFSETVAASDTDEELVAAVTSKKIRVIALVVQCAGTATTCTFESGGSTRKHKVPAGANGGQVLPPNPWGWFETAAGESLTVTTGAGSDTEISGVYVEV